MTRVLILGGTTEASAVAATLAQNRVAATLSYAGRVAAPRSQPVPVRIGGFGGAEGLARYIAESGTTHLLDATHPFAATISANAVAAAEASGIPLIALTRKPWQPAPEDRWHPVPDLAAAVADLAGPPRRVMLALGRMHVEAFAAEPQHHYLLRFVDAPDRPPCLPDHHLVVDRGPFTLEADRDLLRNHRIDLVVCKNAGGAGASAKLTAARELGIAVTMIDRPPLPPRHEVESVEAVLDWLAHSAHRGV